MKNKYSANYEGVSLVNGGVIYTLTAIFRGKSGTTKALFKTALTLVGITWVPMCVLALFSGTLHDTDNTISFFEDFLIHVRYLFAAPFFILIERMVDRSFVGYVQNSDQLILNFQQDSFGHLVKRLNKLANSYLPEILMLVIIFTMTIVNWTSLSFFNSGRNYLVIRGTRSLSAAGWYYLLVCSPIFQLLLFRWIWRWLIWAYSIIKISTFKLHVDPLHADHLAGLEFLNVVPLAFSYILLAPSAVLSAYIGVAILFNGKVFSAYIFPIAAYVFLLPIILYAPLLVFMPFLIKAKMDSIPSFGNLIRKHNYDYATKWIESDPPKGEQLLGTVDNSSLADINGSYASVQNMKLIPVNFNMILISFAINAIPYIPLVFTYYSAADLFKLLLDSLIGG
jgi:hypothetical protein